jgi:ADP-heptose:LPS heptosyltransferase
MKTKRYVAPTGIHGLRRRVVRWLFNRFSTPVAPSTQVLPARGIDRILICRTSHSLGNTLLLTPLLAELERVYPGAEIDIVTQSPVARDLYRNFFSLRTVFLLPSRFPQHMLAVWRVVKAVRRTSYDLVIDPDHGSKTARALLAIAHGRYKLGFCGPEKNGQVTHAVAIPEHVHHVAKLPVYLLRAALQRGDNSDAGYPVPDIRLSRIERAAGNKALARIMSGAHATCRPVVGVFANATGAKRLEGHWWKAMLNRLEMLLPGYAFIEFTPVLGASMLDLRYPTQYCSDLRKLTAVISQLAAFISVDGGLMHVAWASGATTLGLFTSTDVETWGPYGSNVTVINARNFSPEAIASIAAKGTLKAVVRVDPTLSTLTLV